MPDPDQPTADSDRYTRQLAREIAGMLSEHSPEARRAILAMASAILELEPAPAPPAADDAATRAMQPAPPRPGQGYETR
jgi:hypothetical protein